MTRLIKGGGSKLFRGPKRSDGYPLVSYQTIETVLNTEDASSNLQVNDHIVDRFASTTVRKEAQLTIQAVNHTVRNKTPQVAILNESLQLTKVGSGNARVLVENKYVTLAVSPFIGDVNNAQPDLFKNYVVGSFGRAISDYVDSLLIGKTMSANGFIFLNSVPPTGSNLGNLSYTGRNPDVWFSGDTSCVSTWKPNTTVISPSFVIGAAHFPTNGGNYVSMSGTSYFRTFTANRIVPGTDIIVYKLNQPLPIGITPAKFLPADFEDYVPGITNGIPCLCVDQEKKALVTDLYLVNSTSAIFKVPIKADRLSFYEPKVGGDSGNPAFIPLPNNTLAIVTAWTGGGAGSGPDYNDHTAAIQTKMNEMGNNGESIQYVDLSAYGKMINGVWTLP